MVNQHLTDRFLPGRSLSLLLLPIYLALANPALAKDRHVKIIWAGSGFGDVVQTTDVTTGATDDIYHKDVTWKITWTATISGKNITKLSKPTAKISGSYSQSVSHQGDCSGKVGLPYRLSGRQRKYYVPVDLQRIGTSSRTITVRVVGNPLGWTDVPACDGGTDIPVQERAGSNAALNWIKKYEPSVFALSVSNNYKPSPLVHKVRYPFPPIPPQKVANHQWQDQIKVEPN